MVDRITQVKSTACKRLFLIPAGVSERVRLLKQLWPACFYFVYTSPDEANGQILLDLRLVVNVRQVHLVFKQESFVWLVVEGFDSEDLPSLEGLVDVVWIKGSAYGRSGRSGTGGSLRPSAGPVSSAW